ncbi:MAG: extracellular solute-binding protein [Nitrososphaeraceae archaeon]
MISRTTSISSLFMTGILLIFLTLSNADKFETVIAQEEIIITAIVAEPKERWDILFENATKILNERYEDKNIVVDYRVLPYSDTRTQILTAMAGNMPVDLVSIDQIWLGEFAEGGFLYDMTDKTKQWNKTKDWYKTNWLAGIYDNKVNGIWAWTDVRALWYWKDFLNQSGIDQNQLSTWQGYISAFNKLQETLKDKNISPMHLVGAKHSPDMWYPYLWMLNGTILTQKEGHPTKGTYWYPTYNDEKGIEALNFIKEQVEAGIKPQVNHFWGQEFADKKFAVMLEGSWILGQFPRDEWNGLEEKIGIIPTFPMPNSKNNTDNASTMMGGWMLSIPNTSQNKELAWELITIMLDPKVLTPMLINQGYLPTQKSIGEGEYSVQLKNTIPYYDELISMIEFGNGRPNIPEYPQIAEQIRQAIEQVYHGQDPQVALDDAFKKSLKTLGWE